jgi:hypothetical protein
MRQLQGGSEGSGRDNKKQEFWNFPQLQHICQFYSKTEYMHKTEVAQKDHNDKSQLFVY